MIKILYFLSQRPEVCAVFCVAVDGAACPGQESNQSSQQQVRTSYPVCETNQNYPLACGASKFQIQLVRLCLKFMLVLTVQ
jgi:hypothetical protein